MNQVWNIAEPVSHFHQEVAHLFGLHPITAQILWNRGIRELAAIESFLKPSLQSLPNPFLLPDMEKACAEIIQAMREKRVIALFGDYDADGVSSAAIVARFFAELHYPLEVFLPHRERDGYGLSKSGIDHLASCGAQLLITVDNGSSAQTEINYARQLGIQVIVTDHHEVDPQLSGTLAHINPKLLSTPHAFEGLSGSGVAFFLIMALRKTMREAGLLTSEPSLKTALSLATIGTITDVMPLTKTNRTLVSFGLKELRQTQLSGLQALMSVSKTRPSELSPMSIGFRLGPRINAAGRLGHPKTAFDLLCTRDPQEAAKLAQELQALNLERQTVEEKILREAHAQIQALHQAPAGLVCFAPHWHIGVMGIVASRLVEAYQRPVVVCAGNTAEIKGSARAPRGMHLVELLKLCSADLLRFGGHAEAAGVTLHQDKRSSFQQHFAEACALQTASSAAELKIDALLSPSEINDQLMAELELLEPFGHQYPAPLFCAQALQLSPFSIVGKHHLKFQATAGSLYFDAIAFDQARNTVPSALNWDIAYRPEWNEWNGNKKLQLNVKALVGQN